MYSSGTLPASVWNEDAARGVLTGTSEGGEPVLHALRDQLGLPGLDAPARSLFLFNQAAATRLRPGARGTYSLIGYEKKDESATAMKPGDPGFGRPPSMKRPSPSRRTGKYTIGGDSGMLVPFKGSRPRASAGFRDCNGLFSLNKPTSDGFLGFLGDALFLATFTKLTDPWMRRRATYRYGYGVGLRKK